MIETYNIGQKLQEYAKAYYNGTPLVSDEEFDALRTRHEAVAARLAALEAKRPTTADSLTTTPARRKTTKVATSRTKKAAK